MKLIIKYSLVVGIVLTKSVGFSQQLSFLNTNLANPTTLNPAKIGEKENEIFLHHRNQWIGIEGAPDLSLLTSSFKLGGTNSGIGFHVSNENFGIFNTVGGYVTYAHHFKIKNDQSFSMGIDVGVKKIGIDYAKVITVNDQDPILPAYDRAAAKFDINFGLSYRSNNFEAQLSALQLLGNIKGDFENHELDYLFSRHFFASLSYKIKMGKTISLIPIVQAVSVQGLNVNPEIIALLDFNDVFWIAGQYKYLRATAITVGINFKKAFTVSYSAEFATHELIKTNGGTHEIVFGIKLDKLSNKRGGGDLSSKKMEKTIMSYEERLEYMTKENVAQEQELEQQKQRIADLEKKASSLTYAEVQAMIDEANKNRPSVEIIKQAFKTKAESIQFEIGNAVLKTSSYIVLDEIIKVLKENESVSLTIKGFADSSGNDKNNLTLSQDRADTVKDYILSKNIDELRILSVGLGTKYPIATNETMKGRELNRRVELEVK